MPTIPNNVDWSATAAWIALAISIVGTVAGPLVTTWLNNRHQLKMHKLTAEENRINEFIKNRDEILHNFISSVGKCIANCDNQNISDFGSTYFAVYPYIPKDSWKDLDLLYRYLCDLDIRNAAKCFTPIAHMIADLLKEPPR